jgi:hypothetical protein
LEIIERWYLWTKINLESKRDPVINQVPIATKQALLNYGTLMKLLAVTKCKEESPYKPDVPGSCSKSGIVRKSAR